MNANELRALAERVMALTTDDQECAIREASWAINGGGAKHSRVNLLLDVQAYESAAMTLVPDGCQWQVSTQEPGPWAWVGNDGLDPPAVMAAATALALTAAALLALAATGETE